MAKQEETAKVQIQEFDINQFKNETLSVFEKYKKIISIVGIALAVVVGGIMFYFIGYLGPKEKKASVARKRKVEKTGSKGEGRKPNYAK
jgi:Tfp pilus assembly protein PilO